MSKKLVLLASVALVVLCGLMFVSANADAADPAPEEGAEPNNVFYQDGCVITVDLASLATENPKAVVTYDKEKGAADVKIPGYFVYEDPETGDKTECQIQIGKDRFYQSTFRNNATIVNLEIGDASKTSKPIDFLGMYDKIFNDCKALKTVKIGTAAPKFISSSFNNCPELTTVTISGAVEELSSTFSMCKKLTTVNLSEGLKTLAGFNGCESLKDITIPSSVTKIGNFAFYGCKALALSKGIPAGVTEIGESAFAGCEKLSFDINPMPSGITAIGKSAFQNCFGIKELVLPAELITIGNNAFENCFGITSVEIPNKVTTIGDKAFAYNVNTAPEDSGPLMNITSVKLGESVESVGKFAFKYCQFTTVTVPDKLVELPGISDASNGVAGYWPDTLEAFVVSDKHPTYKATDGMLYEKGAIVKLSAVPFALLDVDIFKVPAGVEALENSIFMGASFSEVTLNKELTKLPDNCFKNCKNLTTVKNLESIQTAGKYAFQGCVSLTKVVVPNLQEISVGMFSGCTNLEDVDDEWNGAVTKIGAKAFSGCSKLNLGDNWIWGSLTEVGAGAFRGCTSLSWTELPNALKIIGDSAFSGCTSLKITSIAGSVKSIGSEAFANSGIEKMTVGDATPIAVGLKAFFYCDELTSLYLKNVTMDAYSSPAFYGMVANGASLTTVKYADDFDKWKQNGPLVMSTDGKTIYWCLTGYSGPMEIPATVTNFQKEAFKDSKITELTFEEGRTETLTTGSNGQLCIFKNCKNLEVIILPETMQLDHCVFGGCDAVRYFQAPDSSGGNHDRLFSESRWGVPCVKFCFDGKVDLNSARKEICGMVWIGSGNGILYPLSMTSTYVGEPKNIDMSEDVELLRSTEIYGNVNISGKLTLASGVSLTITDKATVSGEVAATNNLVRFDNYAPVGGSTFVCGTTLLDVDASAESTGDVTMISRISDAFITGFQNNGTSVVVDLETYVGQVPDGKVLIQYSVYVEKDGMMRIDPFRAKSVNVSGDTTVVADIGEKVATCAVSYSYDFAGVSNSTPVSFSASTLPAEYIDIECPNNVSVELGGTEVVDGNFVAYGAYKLVVTGEEGAVYTVNGKDVSEIESFVYLGQKLIIEKKVTEEPSS